MLLVEMGNSHEEIGRKGDPLEESREAQGERADLSLKSVIEAFL